MRHFLTSTICAAFFLALYPDAGSAMTSQELCSRVFEQYGLKTEECDFQEDNKAETANGQPDAETRENHIFFSKGGAKLDAQATTQLSVLVHVLQTSLMRDACLRLVGHSDTSGPSEQNMQIAMARANTVASYLKNGLNNHDRVREITTEGENRPLPGFAGTSPFNRRVEIFAKTCD